MSLKGSFEEISFAEVLKLVAKHNGRLGVWNFEEKKQYEMFFLDERVVYFSLNGKFMIDASSINVFIEELCRDKESYYAFQKDALLEVSPQVSLPISKVMAIAIISGVDSTDLEKDMPNLETRFELAGDFKGEIPGLLGTFWNMSIAHFHMGCSVSEVANMFSMPIRDVQISFAQLRTLGAIRPARLFRVNTTAAKARSAGSNLQRIIQARNAAANPANPAAGPLTARPAISEEMHVPPIPAPIRRAAEALGARSGTNGFNPTTPAAEPIRPATIPQAPIARPGVSENAFTSSDVIDLSNVDVRPETPAAPIVKEDSNPNSIYEPSTGFVKEGIVRRMLSSIFSRRLQN